MAFTYENRADADNAAIMAGLVANDVVCRDNDTGLWGWQDSGSDSEAPEAAHEVERTAQAGDMVLQISGPMLPVAAKLLAAQLARKLGTTVILRDAMDMTEVARVNKGDKPEKSAKIATPNENQTRIIELATRSEGVGGDELFEAGCGGKAKKGTIAWRQLVEACTRFGYEFSLDGKVVTVTNNGKSTPVVRHVYRLAVPAAQTELDQAA